jgi:ACT domain-containing protein
MLKDSPGELKKVLDIIYKFRGNIIEIRHDRFGLKIPPGFAKADLVVELPSKECEEQIRSELRTLGFIAF